MGERWIYVDMSIVVNVLGVIIITRWILGEISSANELLNLDYGNDKAVVQEAWSTEMGYVV